MQNARSTMTGIHPQRESSTKWCRTDFTMQSVDKRLQRLYTQGQTITRNTWDCKRGRMHQKNYLPEKEIRQLERAVTGYFDYIEDLIERENAFNMEQFAASVNEFLTFRRYALLPDKGKISREEADRKAEEEYKLFNPKQKIDSDFDKEIRGLRGNIV